MLGIKPYQSWGRFPKVEPEAVVAVNSLEDVPDLAAFHEPLLAYAYGRSYGDSCLNQGGVLLDTHSLNRFIDFDEQTGLMRCEAGVMLADILQVAVPRGWFLPVSPGTKFVSVGGAIANDIHGKNHHKAGTFGCHVPRFELLRSNGDRLICSVTENSELYRATIGGMGLTGLILWADVQLKAIINPYFDVEYIKFGSLDEFFEISVNADKDFDYTVSWIDCLTQGAHQGRGQFMGGNHNHSKKLSLQSFKSGPKLTVPLDFPSFALNTLSVKAFNFLYYNKQIKKRMRKVVPYEPFFYPLDSIYNWNRIYGRPGFMQYQLVVPETDDNAAIRDVLSLIAKSGEGSFLVVLKKFGDIKSPGMMSFPQPGVTLALDFSNRGEKTFKLLDEFDAICRSAGGRVYPAKDARMSPESFAAYYPQWQEFSRYIDPHFSSSFWRRVTEPLQATLEQLPIVQTVGR